jgi:hypothetical protein
MINRVEFFKQFLHLSLSTNECIDKDKNVMFNLPKRVYYIFIKIKRALKNSYRIKITEKKFNFVYPEKS